MTEDSRRHISSIEDLVLGDSYVYVGAFDYDGSWASIYGPRRVVRYDGIGWRWELDDELDYKEIEYHVFRVLGVLVAGAIEEQTHTSFVLFNAGDLQALVLFPWDPDFRGSWFPYG